MDESPLSWTPLAEEDDIEHELLPLSWHTSVLPPLPPPHDDLSEHSAGSRESKMTNHKLTRRKKKALPKAKKQDSIVIQPSEKQPLTTELKVEVPAIKPLSELMVLYPHLGTNSRRVPMGLAPTSSPATAVPPSPKCDEDPNNIPHVAKYTREYLQSLIDRLQKVTVIPTGTLMHSTKEAIAHEITHFKIDVPISTASHESMLLRAGGRHRFEGNGAIYNFPLCSSGPKCVGVVHGESIECLSGIERSHVLCAYMTPHEWKDFINDNRPPPEPLRQCVLCHRERVLDLVFHIRGHDPVQIPDVPIHTYINLRDQTDGYIGEAVCRPTWKEWEGLTGDLAVLRFSLLKWTINKYGQPMIDQSAMVWKLPMPVTVEVGENLH